MGAETKPCPKCGKLMIRDAVAHYADMAGSVRYDWWCAWGHREDAGIVRGTRPEDMRLRRWEEAQPDGG